MISILAISRCCKCFRWYKESLTIAIELLDLYLEQLNLLHQVNFLLDNLLHLMHVQVIDLL